MQGSQLGKALDVRVAAHHAAGGAAPGPHADSPLTRRSKWHGDAVWRGASMWHGDAARYHAGAVVLLDEETPCIVEGYGDGRWRVRPLRSPGTLILAREERLQLRFAVLPGNVGSARGRVRLREGSGRVVVDAAVPAGAPLFEEAPFLVTPSGVARMRDERWRAYLHMQVGAQRSEAMRRALEAFDALGAGGACRGARRRRSARRGASTRPSSKGRRRRATRNCGASRRRACGASSSDLRRTSCDLIRAARMAPPPSTSSSLASTTAASRALSSRPGGSRTPPARSSTATGAWWRARRATSHPETP